MIKDEKVGLKIGNGGPDKFTMGDQQVVSCLLGFGALIAQRSITQHLADRHAG